MRTKLFIKKEAGKYFISGGLGWLPAPHITAVDPERHQFVTDDFKPAMYYAVNWRSDLNWWEATVNEGKKTTFQLPANATDEEIRSKALEHANLNGMDNVKMHVLTRPVIENETE